MTTCSAAIESVSDLLDLIQAPIRWRILEAGLTLGLFDTLADAQSVEAVAGRHDLAPERLVPYLNAATALGLLTKHAGAYRVRDSLAPYLLSSGARSVKALLLSMAALRQGDVAAALRGEIGGPPLDMGDAAFWDRSAASLHVFHKSLGAPMMAGVLEALPVWPAARRVLDLGAGSEVLALTLAGRNPDVHVTVLDLPPLAERIRQALSHSGPQADRVAVLAGDYNTLPLGGAYDVIWASMTLYYAHDLVALLRKARQALAPGGVFVSVHEGLTAERTAPQEHVVGRLLPALRGQDLSFDKGRIAEAMREAGFARVESRSVATAFGTMDVDLGWLSPVAVEDGTP